MGLAEGVDCRHARIVAHPHRSYFVDDGSRDRNTVAFSLGSAEANNFTTHGFDDFGEGTFHVARLFPFVIGPLEVEAQHGDSPFVDNLWIDLTIAMVVGNHLTTTGKAHRGAIFPADSFFQTLAVPVLSGVPME